ncbi:MFS transporter [Lactobacillus halodurans]|uniref:MFS transporter n=1 Tax=Companilactobacillus halodurans TaxID=2584183 RepID=A0A5P0ZMG0_9LACO|nr:MFS transporter [Companilactobacillus halodurans]MQS75450.1 MFS transporter [Companilactobacillus halodurans]
MEESYTSENKSVAQRTNLKPRVTFALLYVAYVICFIDRSAINIALSYIGTDFNLSTTTLGVVSSAFFFSYALMQIPGGWLTDKFGTKKTILFAISIWSVFTIFTGFAWSLVSLLFIRILFGIGEGAFPSASLKQISESVSYEKRSGYTSGIVSSNYIGAAIAPLLIAPIMANFGWRSTFHVMGILGIVFVISYFLILRNVHYKNDSTIKSKTKIDWSSVLKNRLIWQFFVVVFGLSMVTKGLDSWMPTYLLQARHINLAGIAWLVPLPSLAAGLGAILSGWIMSKLFNHREKWLIALASLLATVFMYGMYSSKSLSAIITFEIATYFFKSIAFSSSFAFFAILISKKAYGSSVGIVNFGGQLAGFIAPLLIGYLVQIFGGSYSVAFLFLVFAAGIAFVAALTFNNKALIKNRQAASKAE